MIAVIGDPDGYYSDSSHPRARLSRAGAWSRTYAQ
jgi:hypothetical protein